MTQRPVRRPPGIPMWVWILVLIAVVAVLWWILADPGPGEAARGVEEIGRARPASAAPATGDGTVRATAAAAPAAGRAA